MTTRRQLLRAVPMAQGNNMEKTTKFLFGGKHLYVTLNVIMLILTAVSVWLGLFWSVFYLTVSVGGIIFLLILNVLGYILGTSSSWGFGVILSLMGGFIGTFISVHTTDKFIDRRYMRIVNSLFIIGIWVRIVPVLISLVIILLH